MTGCPFSQRAARTGANFLPCWQTLYPGGFSRSNELSSEP